MRSAAGALIVCLFTLTGCARYEYHLVEPPELARHIGREVDVLAERDPITYRLRTVDNRLVLRAYNNTDEAIELLGDQSYVVDPEGETHPLRGMAIAPHSFIKLIFPPPRPQAYPRGPTFGIGVGYGISSAGRLRRHYHSYYPYDGPPRYAAVMADRTFYYGDWDWDAGEAVRLLLVYRVDDREVRHPFVFRRVKM